MTLTEALAAWGAYDRDDPFPVFAQVRGEARKATCISNTKQVALALTFSPYIRFQSPACSKA